MKDKCKNEPSLGDKAGAPKCVCGFASLHTLLIGCAAIAERNYRGESSLYANREDGTYYLIIEEPNFFLEKPPVYPEMFEFSFQIFRLPYLVTILDRCDTICSEHAVETMAALK